MRNCKEKEIYCLDDEELQNYLAFNSGRYYDSDLVEQREYSLEEVHFSEDGINISLRIENLYNSESYLIQKIVA